MKYSIVIIVSVSMVYSHDTPPCVIHFHMTNDICAMAQQKQATYSMQTMQPCRNLAQRSISMFSQHRKKLAILSTLSGVSALYYRLYCYKEQIDALIWGQWKGHLALHHLVQLPRDELIKELLLEIQRVYINPDNPTDSLYPITTFTQKLQAEWHALTNYLWWYSWCSCLYMVRWFPFDQNLLEKAPEQLQRIEFIQTLLRTWIAEQNFLTLTHAHDVA